MKTNRKIDWILIQKDYEINHYSLRFLAKKYRISYSAVSKKSMTWAKNDSFQRAIENKLEENIEMKTIEQKVIEKIAKTEIDQKVNNIIDFVSSKAVVRKQILDKLQEIIKNDKEKTTDKIKALDMLAKYAGLYSEDNSQRNPFAGVSKEERLKLAAEKARELGFMIPGFE